MWCPQWKLQDCIPPGALPRAAVLMKPQRSGEKPSTGPRVELEQSFPRAGPRLAFVSARTEGESLIGVIADFMSVTLSQPICSGAARFINLGAQRRRRSEGLLKRSQLVTVIRKVQNADWHLMVPTSIGVELGGLRGVNTVSRQLGGFNEEKGGGVRCFGSGLGAAALVMVGRWGLSAQGSR